MTKSTMLIASIMALAAFAMPSMASAANWGPVNTNHTLTGTGFYFNVYTFPTTFVCNASLGVHARTPASSTLDITSATFSGCFVNDGAGIGCQVTAVASGLPWTATGTSTSDVRINVAHITVTYSNPPGGGCGYPGLTGDVSGTLTGGAWSAAAHSVTYATDPGLSINYAGFIRALSVTTVHPLTDSGVNPLTLT